MRVLQARFHPERREASDFVVVGHVVWDEDDARGRAVVQPSPALIVAGSPAVMLAKLQYLVALTAPESFERLLALKSRFWTFVEVPA